MESYLTLSDYDRVLCSNQFEYIAFGSVFWELEFFGLPKIPKYVREFLFCGTQTRRIRSSNKLDNTDFPEASGRPELATCQASLYQYKVAKEPSIFSVTTAEDQSRSLS